MADVRIELDDGAESLQAKETAHDVPVGVWALFGGLVVWGIYYFFAYVGWNQAEELEATKTALSTNIAHTIAYTAIPATAALVLAIAMKRRAKRAR
jgi:TRAP-type C4-dicarboxylate transport system permease small subunit